MTELTSEMQASLSSLRLAVVGHQEWVTFLQVDALPTPGRISRALRSLEEPAGAGAVAAVQLARLTGRRIPFFTALGRDAIGEQSIRRLVDLGVDPHVAWRDRPSRRGISLVDDGGDRAITVIGERHSPYSTDPLPWNLLDQCDGVFVSATDADGLRLARKARVLTATPRLRLPVLEKAAVCLDALIGSALDPSEQIEVARMNPPPRLTIATEGANGGCLHPGGRYEASPAPSPTQESYGCGDSFAAGVTAGLAGGWQPHDAVRLGAHCGAECVTRFGPY